MKFSNSLARKSMRCVHIAELNWQWSPKYPALQEQTAEQYTSSILQEDTDVNEYLFKYTHAPLLEHSPTPQV
jgi:hypothetical protein